MLAARMLRRIRLLRSRRKSFAFLIFTAAAMVAHFVCGGQSSSEESYGKRTG
jgi:hypothetical protein